MNIAQINLLGIFNNRLKAIYFVIWAGNGILYPFEPVFFGALGIPKSKIGILTMMPSIFRFVFAPVFGLLGDTFKIHTEILITALILSAVAKVSELYMSSFSSLLMIMMLSSFCLAPVYSQIDSLTLSLISDRSIYGSMRLWGAVSYGLFTLLGGIFISFGYSSPIGKFWKLFYLFGFCFLVGCGVVYSIAVGKRRRINELDEEIGKLVNTELDNHIEFSTGDNLNMKNVNDNNNNPVTNCNVLNEVLRLFIENKILFLFYTIMFLSGVAAGVIESFLFLRLEELGGNGIIMGLSKVIMCAAEVPIFRYTGFLQKKYGTWCLLSFTQLAYVFRFIYYTLARNPWVILPCEILHGFTYAMNWSVSCTYVNEISTSNCATTMQALNDGLHRGIGYAIGTILGGFIYQYSGAVVLFAWSGVLSTFSLVLALFFMVESS